MNAMKLPIAPLLLILIVSCSGRDSELDTAAAQPEAEAEEHQEIVLEPEVALEWGIETGRTTSTDIISILTLPGILEMNLNQTAHVSPVVSGKVVEVVADLGLEVRRGQVLLTINSPDFAHAQATYLETSARFNLSQREHERAVALFREKAIEEREFQRRESQHELIAAELGAAESILHSYGLDHAWMDELKSIYERMWREGGDPDTIANPILQVKSPISGRVIFRDVIVGEQVDIQKILFTVSDLSTVWAQLDVYEKDLPDISRESSVIINSLLYPATDFPATITYISDMVDEALRTVKIRVEVENTGRLLKPNMFIEGLLLNRDPARRSVAVPEKAIQQLEGEKIVFVLETDHVHSETEESEEEQLIYAVRHVEVGRKIGFMNIILSGLQEGELIVVEGAFTLKAELAKGSAGHAHVH